MKKRLVKISAWVVGVLVGIFLLISGGLYFFKDEICAYVITEVNKHLKAKVKVAEVDLTFWGSFPNVSVDFNNVFIQDSYENATERDTLLFTDRIRLEFNASDIWNEVYDVKEIDLFPGTLQLKVNSNGEVNYAILKETSDTTSSNFNLTLEKVNFNDIRFKFENQLSEQYYSTLIEDLELDGAFSEKQYTLHSKSNLFVNYFKSGNVSLINNKSANFDLDLLVNQEKGTVEFPKAKIFVANLPFDVDGIISTDKLYFHINASEIELQDVANNFSISSVDNIKKFSGKGKVRFDATIEGEIASSSPPEVLCDFGVKNGQLTEPALGLKLTGIYLNGRYSSKGGKAKEFLSLSNVSFNTIGGPFKGNLMITQFHAPVYKGKAKGNLNLKVLHNLFQFPMVERVNGNILVNSLFEVQSKLLPNESIQYNSKQLEGGITFKNVELKLEEDKRIFKHVDGNIFLRDDNLGVNDLKLNVGKTDLQVNGVFSNVFNYLKQTESLNAEVEITGNFIDVQDLSTETKEERISDGKDWVLPNDINGLVYLNTKELKYEKHHFYDLSTHLKVGKRQLLFNNLSLLNADATIKGLVKIEEKVPEVFTISTSISSNNIDLKSLFKEWNNFEQEVIAAENISGKVSVDLYFIAPFDLKNGINMNAIISDIDLTIENGRLKDVMTFKEITESVRTSAAKLIISKEASYSLEQKLLDLQFATLHNILHIEKGNLTIPSMEIKSNALDINLQGTHDFENQIDYRFSFRLRDVQLKNNNLEFGEVEDDRSGMKIFLRMYGDLYDPTIEWDKAAKKEQAKENRAAAKRDAKSILKTEFGLYKGDSTVQLYQEEQKPKETVRVVTEPEKEEAAKVKKETKIGKTLKKWKQQAEEENKVEFNIGD